MVKTNDGLYGFNKDLMVKTNDDELLRLIVFNKVNQLLTVVFMAKNVVFDG